MKTRSVLCLKAKPQVGEIEKLIKSLSFWTFLALKEIKGKDFVSTLCVGRTYQNSDK